MPTVIDEDILDSEDTIGDVAVGLSAEGKWDVVEEGVTLEHTDEDAPFTLFLFADYSTIESSVTQVNTVEVTTQTSEGPEKDTEERVMEADLDGERYEFGWGIEKSFLEKKHWKIAGEFEAKGAMLRLDEPSGIDVEETDFGGGGPGVGLSVDYKPGGDAPDINFGVNYTQNLTDDEVGIGGLSANLGFQLTESLALGAGYSSNVHGYLEFNF